VLFSQNKSTSNQPTVIFSQNKSAPAKRTGFTFLSEGVVVNEVHYNCWQLNRKKVLEEISLYIHSKL
jgi:hypothetical protein